MYDDDLVSYVHLQWQQWTNRGAVCIWYLIALHAHPPSRGYWASDESMVFLTFAS